MKNFAYLCCLAALLAGGLAGCNKDKTPSEEYWISYGTVTAGSGGYGYQPAVLRDDGMQLSVEADDSGLNLAVGDRLLMHYSILGQSAEGYTIRLNEAVQILCKAPLVRSAVTEDDHVGDDPIEVADAWFSGKYLNVEFGIQTTLASIMHFINLVREDAQGEPGTIHVTLCHDAQGDAPGSRTQYRFVSFDLTGLLSPTETTVTIVLHWTGYDGQPQQDTGTFTLPAYVIRLHSGVQ